MNSQVHHMLDSHSHVTEFADQVGKASKGTQMSRQIATQVLAKDKGMQCIEYSMLCNVMSYTLCVIYVVYSLFLDGAVISMWCRDVVSMP